ncbi:MAG: cytochrome C [bacterium]
MIRKSFKIIIITALLIGIAALCSFAEYKSAVTRHPVEITSAPICSDCHTDERAVFNHTADYAKKHGLYASQKVNICEGCHSTAFCTDCHANKEELKPSDKYKDSPERFLPHRGNYIIQHRIDGKINPAPCMKCHGRKNNARCKACHK